MMLRTLVGKSLKYFKLCPLPQDSFGIIARTYAAENRIGDVKCTSKSCKRLNDLKKGRNMSCSPKVKSFSVCDKSKEDPSNPKEPCCDMDRLKRDPCAKSRTPNKKKQQLNRELPKKSVWEFSADCCGNPCPDMLPRFDSMYYRMKDKINAKYQQTWVECPFRRRPRNKPCLDINELPPLDRRTLPKPCGTACPFDASKLKELCCLSATKGCPRIKMPGCLLPRIPPKCLITRTLSKCQKRCCPYPAFAECCRKCPPRLRKRECGCLRFRLNCEAYSVLRRKKMYDLPPNLPEWPPRPRAPKI